jgi:hypothetical protein
MKFKLKEDVVTVREESIRIRELTHGERLRWVKIATDDRFRGPSLLVSLGVTDPKLTEEEAGEWPADVVTAVSDAIMALSNMKTKAEPAKDASAKEGPAEKQP